MKGVRFNNGRIPAIGAAKWFVNRRDVRRLGKFAALENHARVCHDGKVLEECPACKEIKAKMVAA